MNANTLRDRILQICEERKLPITELEYQVGISQGMISRWGRVTPSVAVVNKVANNLGVSVDYLIGNSEVLQTPDDILHDEWLMTMQRARLSMSDEEKEKMDALMKISFPEKFGN